MQYEVELKYRVSSLAAVEHSLQELGARFERPLEQTDRYFRHPCRDFAATDEAFRLRRVEQRCWMTYKGPKIDTATKTRRELELALPEGADTVAQFTTLLEALGFTTGAEVHKRRRTARLIWHDWEVEIALDDVDRVGTFVELEVSAGETDLPAARQAIQSLASRLQLTDNIRRSYLEML